MSKFWQDLKYGLRMLAIHPGFTLVAVLTLALGIGANSAIFSVVSAVLLRPLPFPKPDRLVSLESVRMKGTPRPGSASYPDFFDWRARNHVFEHVACYRDSAFTLSGTNEPLHLSGAIVTADFLATLGIAPAKGRDFLPEDEKAGHSVVILSDNLWRTAFGSELNILGRAITLNQKSYTIVGVMPPDFHFPVVADPVQLWATIAGDATPSPEGDTPITTERGAHFLQVIARLRSGVSIAQAKAEMDGIAEALAKEYPDSNMYHKAVAVEPQLHHMVGKIEPALFVLLAAVGCVLLIACANVANLLLSRAVARQREVAIRAALGAGRARVIRQLLTESLLLSVAGGIAGLLLAAWGTAALAGLIPKNVPRLAQIQVDSRVLLFTFGMSMLTGILFGLAPAWHVSRANPVEALKESGLTLSRSVRHGRLRGSLVVLEVGVALALLMGAGLMLRSFARLMTVHPGLDPKNVLTFSVDPPGTYTTDQQVVFYGRLLEHLKTLPGAQSVAATVPLPLSGHNFGIVFSIEGQRASPANLPAAEMRLASPGYFRTMGIPLIQGREFTEHDMRTAPFVAVISESFARQYFPNEDPIGKRIAPGAADRAVKEDPLREIVGVVGDVRSRGLDKEVRPEYYLPYTQCLITLPSFVMRTTAAPAGMVGTIRKAVRDFDAGLPVYNVKTMQQYVGASVAQPRFTMLLLGLFASLALALTGLGLYGVISYGVAQRTHEIGIRLALGAQSGDVLRMVIREGLLLSAAGGVAGIVAGFGLTRFLESQLYGVRPTDPFTFACVAVLLLGVALLACYIPARRAMRVDPIVALRYE